jgi:hypothetical protein
VALAALAVTQDRLVRELVRARWVHASTTVVARDEGSVVVVSISKS